MYPIDGSRVGNPDTKSSRRLPSTRRSSVWPVVRSISVRVRSRALPKAGPGASLKRSLLAAGALAALLVAPAAASAASLGLDQRCYVGGEQASISGSGFAVRSAVSLTRGTDQLTPLTSDNSGSVRGRLLVPDVAFGLVESQVEVTASDGTTTAKAFMNIAKVGAEFTPSTGDLRSLSTSHVISGFGLAETRPSIYLHYVSPAAQRAGAGTVKKTTTAVTTTKPAAATVLAADPPGVKTRRLGLLRGPCGVLKTSPRKLFPFKAEPGSWLLQYDTRPRYTKGTGSSTFLWVARKVTIAS